MMRKWGMGKCDLRFWHPTCIVGFLWPICIVWMLQCCNTFCPGTYSQWICRCSKYHHWVTAPSQSNVLGVHPSKLHWFWVCPVCRDWRRQHTQVTSVVGFVGILLLCQIARRRAESSMAFTKYTNKVPCKQSSPCLGHLKSFSLICTLFWSLCSWGLSRRSVIRDWTC